MINDNSAIDLINEKCKQYSIIEFVINTDLSIDIFQNFRIPYHRNLTILPELNINFVTENASVRHNKLTNLINSPKSISGNFWADNNNLTSLEGIPRYIGGNLHIESNNLIINKENFEILMSVYIGGEILADSDFINAYNRYLSISEIVG
jgi:hypothetical protein